MLEKLAALGRFGLFGFRMLGAIRLSAPQFRDTVRQIYVIGARSLPIIAVGGAFVGLVMTLQGYRTLSTFGAGNALARCCRFPCSANWGRCSLPSCSAVAQARRWQRNWA